MADDLFRRDAAKKGIPLWEYYRELGMIPPGQPGTVTLGERIDVIEYAPVVSDVPPDGRKRRRRRIGGEGDPAKTREKPLRRLTPIEEREYYGPFTIERLVPHG